MATDTKNQNQTASPPRADGISLYNLHNPTRARRVIYDGIPGSMTCHTVDAGATKNNVALHESVVKELRARNRNIQDSDLVPTPVGS